MAQKPIEAAEQNLGKQIQHDLPASGPIDTGQFRDTFEPVSESQFNDLEFMHEPVLIEVAPTADRNAEFLIPLNVNGVVQNVIRGKQQWVKRKFVEVLARAKPVGVTTQEYENFQGDKATRVVKSAALQYPFRVIQDNNPNGYPWLQQILSEPG